MPKVLDNPTLIKIGKKFNKTSAQVCLRWALQKGLCILPKSITPSRILENINVIIAIEVCLFHLIICNKFNFKVFDFNLSEEDMNEIKKLDCNMRLLVGMEGYIFSLEIMNLLCINLDF